MSCFRGVRRWLFASLVILTLCLPAGTKAGELWFAPGDDLNVKGVVAHPDFQELFSPGTGWPTGLGHIDVLQLRSPWFLRMPEADVQQVVSFATQHRIGLAVPLDSVASDTCGQNVEGNTSLKGMDFYPRELQRRGIPLRYVILDEPLYYGHEYVSATSCKFSLEEVAKRVAISIRTVKRYYPEIKIVLAEPVQSLPGGSAELGRFLDAYDKELGEYPTDYRLDVQWQKDWESAMPPLLSMLQARRIGLSVIYNAKQGGLATSDGAWVQSAEANAKTFRSEVSQPPAQVVIQTWDKRPEKILPESDPTTMTGFLKWYILSTGQLNR